MSEKRKKIIKDAQMAIWQDSPIDRTVEKAVTDAWDHQQNKIDELNHLLEKQVKIIDELGEKITQTEMGILASRPIYSRRKLEEENKILLEAVEFYADENNWMTRNSDGTYSSKLGVTIQRPSIGVVETENGKRARAALEKIKEIEG